MWPFFVMCGTMGYLFHVWGGVGVGPKVKVGVLRPVQQPGSYWDRSSELPLVGLEPTEVTAYD